MSNEIPADQAVMDEPSVQQQPSVAATTSSPEIPADQVVMDPVQPSGAQGDEIPADQVVMDPTPGEEGQQAADEEKYGTTEQQIKTAAEGAAQGFLSKPAAVWAETNLLGVNPEDIAKREEVNALSHMAGSSAGLIGGLYSGVGELGLIAKGLEAGQAALKIGEAATVAQKIGSAALKGGIEMGLIQGTDELGNAMLDKADPEAPVASAIAHSAGAALLGAGFGFAGGVGGQVLSKLAETKAGTAASKLIRDMGDRLKYVRENVDPATKMAQEMTDLIGSTEAIRSDLHGANAVKEKIANNLGQDISAENMAKHVDEVSNSLDKYEELMNDRTFKKDYSEWQDVVASPESTQGKKIMATDKLKRQLDARARWGKDDNYGIVQDIREASDVLRKSLEDTSTVGEFGNFQKSLNKLYKENIPKLEAATDRFTQGNRVDPGKFQTYINQGDKAFNKLRTEDLESAVAVHENFLKGVKDIYAKYGMPSPVGEVPLTAINASLKAPTLGSKLADDMLNIGAPNVASRLVQSVIGAGEGYRNYGITGALAGWVGGALAPALERAILRKIATHALPAVLKTLSSDNAQHIYQALDHANVVNSGAQKISRGIANVFKAGSQKAVEVSTSHERDRKKLNDLVENNALGKQVDNLTKDPTATPGAGATKKFALGGQVQADASSVPAPAQSEPSGRQAVFPEQDAGINAAKVRVHNYLNSIRPMPGNRLPFDKEHKSKEKEESYRKALDIANRPLEVLNHVKNGSVTKSMMTHFTSLYPELHNHLSKKLSDKIIEAQMKKEPVPYKLRHGLAMFTGKPMDSTMLPMNIQAAQPLPPPPPPVNKLGTPKRNLKGIDKMSKSYQTPSQSAEEDQGKR